MNLLLTSWTNCELFSSLIGLDEIMSVKCWAQSLAQWKHYINKSSYNTVKQASRFHSNQRGRDVEDGISHSSCGSSAMLQCDM